MTMAWADAVRMVTTDVNRNDWGDEGPMSEADAVAHVRNTMRLPEEPYVPGAYPLDDDGTRLAAAYRMVLTNE